MTDCLRTILKYLFINVVGTFTFVFMSRVHRTGSRDTPGRKDNNHW